MTARESLTASIDHAQRLADTGPPDNREFWRRLAGSLRKALQLI